MLRYGTFKTSAKSPGSYGSGNRTSCTANSSKAGVLARRASLRTGIGKRIHTPHTMAFLFADLFSPMKRAIFRRIEQSLAKKTQRLIVVSPSEGQTLRASGVVDESIIRVVNNGIDPTPFSQAEPIDLQEFGFDPNRPTLALVGLVYAAKGQDICLEALADPALSEYQLLCVGPGDIEERREQAQALGLQERVAFLGSRTDVARILSSVQALVLPSRWEGMPYVVLEAMASGLPVVAHPVDGARDALLDGDTGILCSAIGVEPLRAGLLRLLAMSDTERRSMGERAKLGVAERYSLEGMVQGTLDVYAEVL